MNAAIFSAPFTVEIPPMTVAKDRVISFSPEDEVIARLRNWAQEQGIDISKSRAFGFDVPVSAAEKAKGIRGYEYWLQVPDSVIPAQAGIHAVLIEPFPGGTYIALRITDPFAAPFERIPQGWQTLVKYIKDNNIKAEWCQPGSCLEEVIEIDGVCCMDLLILVI